MSAIMLSFPGENNGEDRRRGVKCHSGGYASEDNAADRRFCENKGENALGRSGWVKDDRMYTGVRYQLCTRVGIDLCQVEHLWHMRRQIVRLFTVPLK